MEEKKYDLNNLSQDLNDEIKRTISEVYNINKINPLLKEERDFLFKNLFINYPSNVKIGSDFYCNIAKNIQLSNNVTIGNSCKISSYSNVYIGSNCNICDNVILKTDIIDYYNRNIITSKPIIINDNVYIGAKTLILGGVTIGKNAYICDGAVVNSDVRENTIVSGNPAKEIEVLENNDSIEVIKDNELILVYDLKNIQVSKDLDSNLWLINKKTNERRILAYKDCYSDVKNIDEVVFVMSDILNVINGNISSSNMDDYHDNVYQSSYYLGYLGATKFDDEIYTVTTDDDDIIAVNVGNNFVKFKRIFDYEISDEKIKSSF